MDSSGQKLELRMMVLITSQKDMKRATAVFEQYHEPVQYLCRGEGTATSELLDCLGLAPTEKAILWCLVPKVQVPELFEALYRELSLHRPGRGIGFAFPISGVSSFIMKLLSEEVQQKMVAHFERSESQMLKDITHSCLMVTINRGHSEDVMTAAKEAGARGGTVINARRLGPDETMKRWGISVQQEKEIVFILAEQEKKLAIMKAIGEKCGLHSEAQGIVISIPVDAVAGIETSAIDPPCVDGERR